MPADPQRVALITGAGKRIGAAVARALAADGWATAVHHYTSADDAAAVVDAIARQGGRAVAVGADLGDASETEALLDRAAEALGPVTCLVNSAALFEYDDIASVTASSFDRHMAVNARAPVLLARQLTARLPEGREGCIINVLDQKLSNLNPDFLSYTLSKVALSGLTELLAMALAPRVRVCGIAPGLTLPSTNMSDARFRELHGTAPLGRGSSVEDLVEAVRFLLGARSITGHTVVVDGGQHLERRDRDVMFSKDRQG